MNKKKTFIYLLIFIQFINAPVFAQNNNKKHNEKVVIVGSTEPVVTQSRKINLTPGKPVQPDIKKDFDFTPKDKYFKAPSKFTPIKPATFRTGGNNDIYNNVIKAGFGTRISPYAEFFHSQSHKGKYKFDFHASHHSSFGNIKGYTDTKYSKSLAEAGYTRFFKQQIVKFNLGYDYNTNKNYFPSTIADSLNTDSLKLAYNDFFFNTTITSNYRNKKRLHHTINIGGYYFFNKISQNYYNKSNELNIYTDFDLHKSFRVTNLLEYQYLGGNGKIKYYRNNGISDITNGIDSSAVNSALISLTPYFKARYGILSFKAGINLSYLYSQKSSHFRVFPDINITVNLFPEYLELYAGSDGNYERNGFKKLVSENPFVSQTIPENWKATKIRFYGGFKGNIAKKVDFNMQINWSMFDNEYFYISTFNDFTQVQPYDNMFFIENDNGSLLNFNFQLTYDISNKANAYVSYNYNSYNLDNLVNPSGKILSELKVGGYYMIKGKFKPRAEIIYVGKRYTLNITNAFISPQEIELKGFVDLNLGLDYYHTENLSGFIKFNNILNNKYQYFYQHPAYGIEMMIGVGYKF